MATARSRFWLRLSAWVVANVAFYLIQQRFGWIVAFSIGGFMGAARILARADFEKALEDRMRLQDQTRRSIT